MFDKMPKGRKPSVNDEDIISAAKNVSGPVFTTREVADQLDVGIETVRNRLGGLVDDNILKYKRAGSGKVYWFIGR